MPQQRHSVRLGGPLFAWDPPAGGYGGPYYGSASDLLARSKRKARDGFTYRRWPRAPRFWGNLNWEKSIDNFACLKVRRKTFVIDCDVLDRFMANI